MRNLKRVLSLALACVMVIGMMVMTTGAADFTDTDEITFTTAVDALTTLNVINGRDDGSFDPTGAVTRAEMAKMICIVHNGGKDPLLGAEATALFTDTVGHWAEAYIAYASNLGIIAGMGDGTFAPDAKVTGTQAAKMLLVTLGYDPEVFALIGDEWDTTTEVIANGIDMFDGLEGTNLSAKLDREKAAQMIYNALNANIMVKSYDKVLSNGQISYEYRLDENKTLLNDTYGAWKVEGYVVGNEYATLDTDDDDCMEDGETQIVVTNAIEIDTAKLGVTQNGRANFAVSTGYDELGKTVILYVKPAVGNPNTWKATVIGGAIMGENTVVTKDGQWKFDAIMDKMLKKAGLKTDMSSSTTYVNGTTFVEDTNPNVPGTEDYNTKYSVNKNGYFTQFIDNDMDGLVDFVLVDQVDFGKVTTYSTAKDGSITISTGASPVTYKDSKLVIGFEDVAKGDYVLYAEVGGRLYVAKSETVTGKLTDYSSQTQNNDDADDFVMVDSTEYVTSGVAGAGCDTARLVAANGVGYTDLNETGVFYLDACGYVIAADLTSPNRYALATYANDSAYTDGSIVTANRAQTYFEDDTTSAPVYATTYVDAQGQVQTPESITGFNALKGTNAADKVFLGAYSFNARGELYMVNIADGDSNTGVITSNGSNGSPDTFAYTSGNVLIQADGANLKNGNFNLYMTDKTVVYFVETKANAANIATAQVGKVTTYVGKDNVPSFKLEDVGAANNVGDYKILYAYNANNEIEAMAVISGNINGVMTNYMYIIEVTSSSANTKTAKVALDGEIQDIVINAERDAVVNTGVNLYSINKNGNYDVTNAGVQTLYTNTVIEKKNTNTHTLVVAGSTKEYRVLDTTVFAHVGNKEVSSFEEIGRNDIVTVLTNEMNAADPVVLGVYVTKSNNAEAPTEQTIATTAGILNLKQDGLYVPDDLTAFPGFAPDASDIVIIKYTAVAAENYTLSIKDAGGVEVFNCGPIAKQAKAAGSFWLTTKTAAADLDAAHADPTDTVSGSWATAQAAPAGTYYYTVTGSTSGAIMSGTFIVD